MIWPEKYWLYIITADVKSAIRRLVVKKAQHIKKALLGLAIVAFMAIPSFALAGEIKIAVAANFENAMTDMITRYKTVVPGTTITPTYGASGTFYANITDAQNPNPNGYTLFFSADQNWAKALVTAGIGDNVQPYAIGQLAAYSKSVRFDNMLDTAAVVAWLKTADFTSGAVANPDVAPYGVAAQQFLSNSAVDLWGSSKIDATFPDIAAAFNAVNATTPTKQVAFVALAQTRGSDATGYAIAISSNYYSPIIQSGCLVKVSGAINSEASAFFNWVLSGDVDDILELWGYALP